MKQGRGKLITLEGIDGSGKATQTRLLMDRLMSIDILVTKIDFPQYGKASSGLVEEYLNGKYGEANEVDPKAAAIFYACDRFSASFGMRENLDKGVWIISDRYVGSNIGHQGGKFKLKDEREDFIKWIFELEYGVFNLPKPDITFILKTPVKASSQRALNLTDQEKIDQRKKYLRDKKTDIHDANLDHLENARQSYIDAAELFPEEFTIIECMDHGEMLSPEIIHGKIWDIVKNRFNL